MATLEAFTPLNRELRGTCKPQAEAALSLLLLGAAYV